MNYLELVKHYFEQRQLKQPNFTDAMKFVITEIAEVTELDLARPDNGWVRNHDKEAYSPERMAEELGDAIMMLLVAGWAEGVDPLKALEDKIQVKLLERHLQVYVPKGDVESPNIIRADDGTGLNPDRYKTYTITSTAEYKTEI
jgi:hypothetical protein